MDNKNQPGALEDTRSDELKVKDWHKEVAMGGIIDWKTKDFKDIKNFPVRNQDGSSSCVAQTIALMAGIENYLEEERFIEFSAKDIYTRRTNPGGGMIGVEALDIWRKYGITFEILIPSQNQGESEMNTITRKTSDKEIGEIFKIDNFFQLPFSVEQIATIMENGRKNSIAKPVMVWFQFPRAEWDSKPDVSNSNFDLVRHSITAIDYGIMDGKKGIFIQDSWGLDRSTENGLRFISEDYIKSRMVFCAYVNDEANDWQKVKVTEEIERPILRLKSKGDSVKELQKILGLKQDGIFGIQTWTKVREFQKTHNLTIDGIVGKNTWAKLLE